MTIAQMPELRSGGVVMDTSPEHFGVLRDSNDIVEQPAALRERIAGEGYLYLPGLLLRDDVLAARREIVRRLDEAGQLKPGTDPMDAIVNPNMPPKVFQPDLAK